MSKYDSDIQPLKFYKKSYNMSGKGRGRAKKRDLITALQIRPAPGKVKCKKLTETKSKAKPELGETGNRSKAQVQHDQFSSGTEEEASTSNDEVA